MRLPPESSSSWAMLAFASFTWASMQAWSEFTELPQPDRSFLAEQAKLLRASMDVLLKEARETQDQTLFGRPEAQARQNAWLKLLQRLCSESVTMVALRLANNVKDSKPVREFLPNLMATVTKAGVADRPKIVSLAATRLAGLTGTFNEKADLVARLEAAAQGAQGAVNANQAAFATWDKERSEEVVAKKRLRADLDRLYKALGIQFQGQDDFFESLFLKGEKPSEGEEEAPAGKPAQGATNTPATPPTPQPATPPAPPAPPAPAAPPTPPAPTDGATPEKPG